MIWWRRVQESLSGVRKTRTNITEHRVTTKATHFVTMGSVAPTIPSAGLSGEARILRGLMTSVLPPTTITVSERLSTKICIYSTSY